MQLTIRMPDEYGEKISRIAQIMGLKKSDIARLAIIRSRNRHCDRLTGYRPMGRFVGQKRETPQSIYDGFVKNYVLQA